MPYDDVAPYPPRKIPKAQRVQKSSAFGDHWDERIADAKELAAAGATDQEMADHFGIAMNTLYLWRAARPDFHAACKMAKEMPDARVQGMSFTMTQGYHYTEQQAIKVKTGEHTEAVEVVDVQRFVPPDKTMLIMWLKNRLGWRDSYDAKVTGRIDHQHTHAIEADPRRLAIALLATLRKAVEAPKDEAKVIDHETD